MSLLQAIKEAEAVVASLKALLGESVAEVQDELWYLNIPKEGVECWVADCLGSLKEEMDGGQSDTRIVYSYEPRVEMRFETDGLSWAYAIPVDPALRLPNGAITL
jgi:hypothetical protein